MMVSEQEALRIFKVVAVATVIFAYWLVFMQPPDRESLPPKQEWITPPTQHRA